jgi:hypothetical protein
MQSIFKNLCSPGFQLNKKEWIQRLRRILIFLPNISTESTLGDKQTISLHIVFQLFPVHKQHEGCFMNL